MASFILISRDRGYTPPGQNIWKIPPENFGQNDEKRTQFFCRTGLNSENDI